MSGLFKTSNVTGSKRIAALTLAAAGACFAVGATPAKAGERQGRDRDRVSVGIEIGTSRHDHRGDDYCEPGYAVREAKVWVEPVYRTVCDRVWVEAEYRTVRDRVWVAAETKVVCEKVWVPDRFECRTVVRRDRHGHLIRGEERVLVERAHYRTVERVVEVCPGRFENVERRELVRPGRFETLERRELVTPGHFEVRRERVRVAERYGDHRSEDFRIGFEWRKH
jgi:hypothetical protein